MIETDSPQNGDNSDVVSGAPSPRLIVFDWDGTLVDSIDGIVTDMCRAADTAALARPAREAVIEHIGISFDRMAPRLFPGADERQLALLDEAFHRDLPVPRLFAGAFDVLYALKTQGWMLAMATGKCRHIIEREMSALEVSALFSHVHGGDEGFSKPDPGMLEAIMQSLEIAPDDTVMVGDSRYDIQMAVGAGVRAVGVTYGIEDQEALRRHGATICIDDIAALPGALHEVSRQQYSKRVQP